MRLIDITEKHLKLIYQIINEPYNIEATIHLGFVEMEDTISFNLYCCHFGKEKCCHLRFSIDPDGNDNKYLLSLDFSRLNYDECVKLFAKSLTSDKFQYILYNSINMAYDFPVVQFKSYLNGFDDGRATYNEDDANKLLKAYKQ